MQTFYEHLYTSEAHDPDTAEAQEECWANTPTKISTEMNSDLIRELTFKEVQNAITAMPKDKASGGDGIPIEFFQEFTTEIALTLLLAFKAMLNSGETSEQINKGIITLIPKTGDHARLGNWHPITLLGSLYKILTKTLAERLQVHLLSIV